MADIKVHNPNNLPLVKISELKPLQGELKKLSDDNYKKLKASIEKHGFIVPIFTWNGFIMDGHGRQKVMLGEGWDIEVPVVEVEADNELEAKEKLLKITSQYQEIDIDGLDSFFPDWGELGVNFDAIDLGSYSIEELPEVRSMSLQDSLGTKEEELREILSISLIYNKADYEEAMTHVNYFKKLQGVDNVSQVVLEVLKKAYEDAISK